MYLELIFHDNDFTKDIYWALYKIWRWVKDDFDINSCSGPDRRSVADSFKFLHERGKLLPMIKKMITVYAITHDVLWTTNGLYSKKYDVIPLPSLEFVIEDAKKYEPYFDKIDIKFHEDNEFIKEHHNGEHGWIDLNTGERGTF